MAYSQFNYKRIKDELGITDRPKTLFAEQPPVEPSKSLIDILERNTFFSFFSEKSRSEGIVINVLAEICIRNKDKVSLYSGPILNADEKRGLNGECDFILSAGEQKYHIDAPLFCLIEAEENDIKKNIPQCIAQMEGARVYNQNEGKEALCMYGCVTTGETWQFLALENSVCWIDTKRYSLAELPLILGILQKIIEAQ